MINNLFKAKIGLEREAVRIGSMAEISLLDHPEVFSEDNPFITKDFGEAQIEMITRPKDSIDEAIFELEDIQAVVFDNLAETDLLWKASNPPIINKDLGISVAKFKSDPKKEEYRKYLSAKYGEEKSIISGTHFNFSFAGELLLDLYNKTDLSTSFTEYKNMAYLKVAKYILLNRWFFIYLTSASPVFHNSYYEHCVVNSDQLNTGDCLMDGLSSLRNSDCGYRNKEEIILDFNSYASYKESVHKVIDNGIIKGPSELYTPVRLKEDVDSNIEYIELRFIDVNPFEVSGVSDIDLKYLHLHIIYALLNDDISFNEDDQKLANKKHQAASRSDILLANKDIAVHLKLKDFFKDISTPYDLAEIYESIEERLNNKDKTYANRLKAEYAKSSYIDYHLEMAIRDKRYSEKHKFELSSYPSLELSTKILIKETIKEGYLFEVIDVDSNFISIQDPRTNKIEYVQQATKTNLDTYANILAMENKVVTKKLLSESKLNTPNGYTVKCPSDIDSIDITNFEKSGVVIKPNTTNFGEGITIYPEGASKKQILEAINYSLSFDTTVLIEPFIKGLEYRFLVIDQKVVGILHRAAANVIGDGISTIRELVEIKNSNPLRGSNYVTPLEKINLGKQEAEYLSLSNLNFDSIVSKDEIVYLRENSNISTGGDSIDYTDLVDKSYVEIAEKAVKVLGVNISGVDIIIEDVAKPADNNNYSILELNFNPAIHIHTYPLIGENREPAAKILKALFK